MSNLQNQLCQYIRDGQPEQAKELIQNNLEYEFNYRHVVRLAYYYHYTKLIQWLITQKHIEPNLALYYSYVYNNKTMAEWLVENYIIDYSLFAKYLLDYLKKNNLYSTRFAVESD